MKQIIPSFRRRQGQLTQAQRKAFRQYDHYRLKCQYRDIYSLDAIYPNTAPIVLEIGFGMGEQLLAAAQSHPDKNYLGIEVHKPGVGAALKVAGSLQLKNLKVVHLDTFRFLSDHLKGAPFSEVNLFFPEPFAKKERLIFRPLLLELIAQRLQAGGIWRIATDLEDYAAHIQSLFVNHSDWQALKKTPRWEERILTKYETKAHFEGRAVYDFFTERKS